MYTGGGYCYIDRCCCCLLFVIVIVVVAGWHNQVYSGLLAHRPWQECEEKSLRGNQQQTLWAHHDWDRGEKPGSKILVRRSQSKSHWKKCSNPHFYCLIRSSLVNMGSSMLEIDSIIMIGRYILVLICLLYCHPVFVLRNHQNLIFSSVPEEVVLCAQLWATHAEGVCFPKKTQKVLIFSTCEIWIRLSQKILRFPTYENRLSQNIRFSFLN